MQATPARPTTAEPGAVFCRRRSAGRGPTCPTRPASYAPSLFIFQGSMADPDYRSRLLARYVTTHASVGDAVAGLARRRPYLDRLVRDHFPAHRDAAVLDLGCGHGAMLWAARRAGYTNL